MKILLDENLPTKIKHKLNDSHDVSAVRDEGWLGKKNGELLGLMVLNGFDALVTIDKNLAHQQNLGRFPLFIYVLDAPNNRIPTLEPYMDLLKNVLDMAPVAQVTVVSID